MNWNIRLAYIQTISFSIGMGIIQIAFPVYVDLVLAQALLVVGALFTVSGTVSTLFVFPSGYLADKYRRDILIRIAVFFGILSQLCLIFSTMITGSPQLALNTLFLAQGLGGLAWGLSGPAGQALIADSTEPGDKSHIFARMHYFSFLASSAGPFIAAGMTVVFGDNWTMDVLQPIILVASLSTITAWVAIVFSSDKKSLVIKEDKSVTAERDLYPKKEELFSYDVSVPGVIVISGLIIGFGAGATVAFFPNLLGTEHGYNLSPFFTYLIFGITNVVSGRMGLVAQKMIKNFGRIGTMFLVQGLAVLCLIGLMVNLAFYFDNIVSFDLSVVLFVVFFVSRNALMNASSPISRSIVMDCVPSASRAKWNSLETLAWGMFWSFSSLLGGFIIDSFGFLYVFLFTSTLYTVGTLMLLLIRNRVPRESILARQYHLGKLKSRNRVVLPSISFGELKAAEDVTGQLTPDGLSYYTETAKGGVGLIYIEPAYVSSTGKGHAYQIGCHDDYLIPRMRDVVTRVQENQALIGIRLTHAGAATAKSLTGFQPMAPSEVAITVGETPRPLLVNEMDEIRLKYVDAAIRAVKAGFDIIEISSILGPSEKPDLLAQFISPDYNKRTDEYGGSLLNRIRFPLEIIETIKRSIPESAMLAYSISVPFQGLSDDNLLVLIKSLEEVGIELLNIDFDKGIEFSQESFLKQLKEELPSMPLILHGGFDVSTAEVALKRGQADFIGFGRLLRQNPSLPDTLR
ncbi:MAG: MFS transporter [Candidatus Heimdallarchaeota archaeon]|nr:MAG: MFS transporter [Candidatus Heimdallarchaeota archaeon]